MLDLKDAQATTVTFTVSTRVLTTFTSSTLPMASRRRTSKISGKTSGRMRVPRIGLARRRSSSRSKGAFIKRRLNKSIETMSSVAATSHTRAHSTRARKDIPLPLIALRVAKGVRSKRKRMSIIDSTIKSSTKVRLRLHRQKTRVCSIASSGPGSGASPSPKPTKSMSPRRKASSIS